MKKILLGQNFLKNQFFLRKIAENLVISPEDTLVEIGGGHGELSKLLLKAKRLIIYEIDSSLAKILKERFASYPNVEIVNDNFLKADLSKLNHQYKLIGNIPYKITGLILRKVFNKENFPKIFVLTVQKEVGEKILRGNNFLSHWLKIWGRIKKIGLIKRRDFYPQPKVDSLALKIEFHHQPLIERTESFAKFLKKLFKHPKRILKNNLNLPSKFSHLALLRPHQLSFEEILEIFKEIGNSSLNHSNL